MSVLNLIGISTAYAATNSATSTTGHTSAAGGFMSMLPFLIIFVIAFYFLLIRPQSKRAKQHRQLMSNISVGDEIISAGGIVGRVAKLREKFVIIVIAKGVEITIQKSSIAQVLPKGTMDSAE